MYIKKEFNKIGQNESGVEVAKTLLNRLKRRKGGQVIGEKSFKLGSETWYFSLFLIFIGYIYMSIIF